MKRRETSRYFNLWEKDWRIDKQLLDIMNSFYYNNFSSWIT
jgi:hypothetical protein